MSIDLDKLGVFRIIHIDNLKHDLSKGLYCKNANKIFRDYVSIGSNEVIGKRDTKVVKCHPNYVVNDYVPFYFSVRTPMLFNIKTGHGVKTFPQKDIVYLCCKFTDLACEKFNWCYTNGNAAAAITKFFSTFEKINEDIDWHSVNTTDFRDENADGDEDRIRKKHAEFLVREHVPAKYIKKIVVLNNDVKSKVEKILLELETNIDILVNPNFYF
ncbi:MAG TPA: DUF4433 domain-containing protein [Mucilaginibacter sp.]|jgi:hypothetical protein|nr:DUF4433 domain-containing protein [Mucilaginibacter sp.]